MARILIVEDEKAISELIKRNLRLVGHECEQAYDGNEALEIVRTCTFDLILLDVMLPSVSGFEIMEHIENTPVIFVTAKDSLPDKLEGLSLGAEDYIVKPFEMLELIARVNVVLRRSIVTKKDSEHFILDNVDVNLNSRSITMCGKDVELTPREYELLEVFIRNRNIALSREKLLELAWNYDYGGDTRTVDVHIQKLRKKLHFEKRIKTIYKMGYRLEC